MSKESKPIGAILPRVEMNCRAPRQNLRGNLVRNLAICEGVATIWLHGPICSGPTPVPRSRLATSAAREHFRRDGLMFQKSVLGCLTGFIQGRPINKQSANSVASVAASPCHPSPGGNGGLPAIPWLSRILWLCGATEKLSDTTPRINPAQAHQMGKQLAWRQLGSLEGFSCCTDHLFVGHELAH